jgi:cytochrome c oxidase cbb3-type subunit III
MPEHDDKLIDHDFDGIQELDNDLPRWWVWLFILTVIWAFIYFPYFHVFHIGYSSSELYQEELNPDYIREPNLSNTYFGIIPRYRSPIGVDQKDVDRMRALHDNARHVVLLTRETDTTVYVAITELDEIAEGKKVFLANCSSCHGKLGEGGVGPNLTDQYWLHGGEFSNVVKTVRYGYPTKGMIAWLGTLPQEDIIKAASYVYTLQGTNPPNAKGPEGELFVR